MDGTAAVALAAIAIAAMTFIATQLSVARSANKGMVESMEQRLKRCEEDKKLFGQEIKSQSDALQEAKDRISYLERRLTS